MIERIEREREWEREKKRDIGREREWERERGERIRERGRESVRERERDRETFGELSLRELNKKSILCTLFSLMYKYYTTVLQWFSGDLKRKKDVERLFSGLKGIKLSAITIILRVPNWSILLWIYLVFF